MIDDERVAAIATEWNWIDPKALTQWRLHQNVQQRQGQSGLPLGQWLVFRKYLKEEQLRQIEEHIRCQDLATKQRVEHHGLAPEVRQWLENEEQRHLRLSETMTNSQMDQVIDSHPGSSHIFQPLSEVLNTQSEENLGQIKNDNEGWLETSSSASALTEAIPPRRANLEQDQDDSGTWLKHGNDSAAISEGMPDSFVGQIIELQQTTDADSNTPTQLATSSELPFFETEQTSFGRYFIYELIGRGGMGSVYRAEDTRLHRIVALKILNEGALAQQGQKRIWREAQLLALLEHPNIVKIYDTGIERGRHYLAMEFIDGIGLQEVLRKKTALSRLLTILAKIVRAMHYAHNNGIIHRDLKPSNIMVTHNDEPKIMDFGLAKNLLESEKLSKSGLVIGTLSYMSPEQAQGQIKNVDIQSDIYSLGAILYQMLTARPPFLGKTAFDMIHQIMTREPLPPSRLNFRISRDLEAICLKALEKEKARRYHNAGQMASDLELYLQGKAVSAQPATLTWRSWKAIRRHRLLFVVTGLIVIVFVLLLIYFGYQMQQNQLQLQAQASKARKSEAQARLNLAVAYLALARTSIAAGNFSGAESYCRQAQEILAKGPISPWAYTAGDLARYQIVPHLGRARYTLDCAQQRQLQLDSRQLLIAISPDNRRAAYAISSFLLLHELGQAQVHILAKPAKITRRIRGVCFNDDGALVAGFSNNYLYIFDTTRRCQLMTIRGQDIFFARFHPRRELLAVGDANGVAFYMIRHRSGQAGYQRVGELSYQQCLAFSTPGDLLAGATGKRIQLYRWQKNAPHPLASFELDNQVTTLHILADKQLLAVVTNQGRFVLFAYNKTQDNIVYSHKLNLATTIIQIGYRRQDNLYWLRTAAADVLALRTSPLVPAGPEGGIQQNSNFYPLTICPGHPKTSSAISANCRYVVFVNAAWKISFFDLGF